MIDKIYAKIALKIHLRVLEMSQPDAYYLRLTFYDPEAEDNLLAIAVKGVRVYFAGLLISGAILWPVLTTRPYIILLISLCILVDIATGRGDRYMTLTGACKLLSAWTTSAALRIYIGRNRFRHEMLMTFVDDYKAEFNTLERHIQIRMCSYFHDLAGFFISLCCPLLIISVTFPAYGISISFQQYKILLEAFLLVSELISAAITIRNP